MATDFLTDLELQHWLVTGRFSRPTRRPREIGEAQEWRDILQNEENRLQEEELEEFMAPVIRGATDENASSILIAHMGIGLATFRQVERVFRDFGEITCIDRNPYYTEKGYVAITFAKEEDAIKAYTELNRAGHRAEKHLNRRIRCYYYEGGDFIQQVYSESQRSLESSSQASSSTSSTSGEGSQGEGRRGGRIQNLMSLLQDDRSVIQDESVEIEEMVNERAEREKNQSPNASSASQSDEISELSPGICKICTVKVVGLAFIPCGHTACTECFPQLNESCPFCRLTVIHTNKIYLS